MLTRLRIRNFKLFDDVELELADRVVLVGPNNAGKTSALQALALWDVGVRRLAEKKTWSAVTINRRDLIAVPVPAANLLWRDLQTQQLEIDVEGVSGAKSWRCGVEFKYANEESFYCHATAAGVPPRGDSGEDRVSASHGRPLQH